MLPILVESGTKPRLLCRVTATANRAHPYRALIFNDRGGVIATGEASSPGVARRLAFTQVRSVVASIKALPEYMRDSSYDRLLDYESTIRAILAADPLAESAEDCLDRGTCTLRRNDAAS